MHKWFNQLYVDQLLPNKGVELFLQYILGHIREVVYLFILGSTRYSSISTSEGKHFIYFSYLEYFCFLSNSIWNNLNSPEECKLPNSMMLCKNIQYWWISAYPCKEYCKNRIAIKQILVHSLLWTLCSPVPPPSPWEL